MSKILTFEVKFHRQNTHWANVRLYKTRSAMRSVLRRLGHDSRNTDAACWQANRPGKDNCVAEIYLNREFLTIDNIAHESSHAAHHHTVLLGVPTDHDQFQEYVADCTGRMTDAILALMDQNKIQVRYSCVNRRAL